MFSCSRSISLLIALFFLGHSSAWAQLAVPADEEGMNDVDITGGMADRSANYAAQCLSRTSPARFSQLSNLSSGQSSAAQSQMPAYNQQLQGQVNCNQSQMGYLPAQPIQQAQQTQQTQQMANPLTGLGISSQQVVGVVGVAAMMHLMSNGGMGRLMGGLGMPIGGGRFHGYGPSRY